MENTEAAGSAIPVAADPAKVPATWPLPFSEQLLGSDEWPNLEAAPSEVEQWVREKQQLLIRTVTWNLCASPPPHKAALQKSLLPKNKFHLYFIGTEECERSIAKSAVNPSKKQWEAYLVDVMGPLYTPIRSHTLQAIHLIAFVHISVAHMCSFVVSAAVATGTANTLGNKGGVSIYMKFDHTTMLITNSHLAAHQNAIKQRNSDFHKINSGIPVLLDRKSGKKGIKHDANSPSVSRETKFVSHLRQQVQQYQNGDDNVAAGNDDVRRPSVPLSNNGDGSKPAMNINNNNNSNSNNKSIEGGTRGTAGAVVVSGASVDIPMVEIQQSTFSINGGVTSGDMMDSPRGAVAESSAGMVNKGSSNKLIHGASRFVGGIRSTVSQANNINNRENSTIPNSTEDAAIMQRVMDRQYDEVGEDLPDEESEGQGQENAVSEYVAQLLADALAHASATFHGLGNIPTRPASDNSCSQNDGIKVSLSIPAANERKEDDDVAIIAALSSPAGHTPIESPRTDDAFSTRANSIARSGSTGEAITFSKTNSNKALQKTLDNYADAVIFMGDLNYRIKGNRAIVDSLLEKNMHEVLVENDQLHIELRAKRVLESFTEPPLKFRPTYKLDIGTDVYDTGKKKRIPAWCDRILYVDRPDRVLECFEYDADWSIKTSDHKPVHASFVLNLLVPSVPPPAAAAAAVSNESVISDSGGGGTSAAVGASKASIAQGRNAGESGVVTITGASGSSGGGGTAQQAIPKFSSESQVCTIS